MGEKNNGKTIREFLFILCYFTFLLGLLALGICSLVITYVYDPVISACSSHYFTIDLVTFMTVAGSVQLSMPIFGICFAMLVMGTGSKLLCPGDYERQRIIRWKLGYLLMVPLFLICVFSLIWSVFGFIMYDEMSGSCRSEEIGKILLSWSIIQVHLSACTLLSSCLPYKTLNGRMIECDQWISIVIPCILGCAICMFASMLLNSHWWCN